MLTARYLSRLSGDAQEGYGWSSCNFNLDFNNNSRHGNLRPETTHAVKMELLLQSHFFFHLSPGSLRGAVLALRAFVKVGCLLRMTDKVLFAPGTSALTRRRMQTQPDNTLLGRKHF